MSGEGSFCPAVALRLPDESTHAVLKRISRSSRKETCWMYSLARRIFSGSTWAMYSCLGSAAAQDLGLVAELERGQIGHARPHLQHFLVIGAEHLDVLAHLRPWPHQAHVAAKHIEQLR